MFNKLFIYLEIIRIACTQSTKILTVGINLMGVSGAGAETFRFF